MHAAAAADLLHDPGFPPVLMSNWHQNLYVPGTASHTVAESCQSQACASY